MKPYIYAVALLLLLVAGGCSKIKSRDTIVIRDCTGTYLRLEGKDYQVCNIALTNDYPSGSSVKASFFPASACDEEGHIVCYMLHPSEG